MKEIENTGERILPEKETPLMIARHLCAYRLAGDYAAGRDVLDIGCGEGYGSDYLAGHARSVLGIDYSAEAVACARSKYAGENLGFEVRDINDLERLGRTFECICCLQVIEHIRDTDLFLKGVPALLKAGGTFICSTPNRLDASPGSLQPCNKFHVKEYLAHEFKELLGGYFGTMNMFGLKRGRRLNLFRRLKKSGILDFLPGQIDPVKRFYAHIDCDDFVLVDSGLESALDFIAVCKGR